jgi:flagellar L-ring protein precursor FlgH
MISESSTAAQEATTRTSKESGIGVELGSGWDQVANLLGSETIRKTYDGSLKGNDTYLGTGQTARKSTVQAMVTAVITEILENGNVYVVGEHKVKVNNEIETIRISGIIRPTDITAANTINSYQIAKAEVSVNGAGVVGSKQSPGVLTKMFSWFF